MQAELLRNMFCRLRRSMEKYTGNSLEYTETDTHGLAEHYLAPQLMSRFMNNCLHITSKTS